MEHDYQFEEPQGVPERQGTIQSLLKAYSKFESFLKNLDTEQEQAGAIQAFEYCFELSWKTMKKILDKRGKNVNSPKESFRMAALEGFISDPEKWFYFLELRNLTVHTYQEKEAQKVVLNLHSFSQELQKFLRNLGINAVY